MRRALWVALGVTSATIAIITFWPTPVDAPAKGTIRDILTTLHDAGVPPQVNYSFVEIASNVVMFIPLGALIAALLPVNRWWAAVLLGSLGSCLIELTQLAFLPHRFASMVDIAANTAGALLGALLAEAIRRARQSRA
jgi:glycopeptide antibiotics resistance protein